MKALLAVSFGTSYALTREKTIDRIDAQLAETFPDRAFYAAWTSGVIVRKVYEERGEHHDTLDEAFARLAADGVDDLVVATSCVLQGREMSKIEKAAREWAAVDGRTMRIAQPLLVTDDDCRELAQVVRDEFAAEVGDDALLLMGHGSPNDAPNHQYNRVLDALRDLGCEKYFIATTVGFPAFEDVVDAVVSCKAQRIYLAPLMIVAGDHANNDLAGDDEDSWKRILEARGKITRPILRGLGEYAGVRNLICERAVQAAEMRDE